MSPNRDTDVSPIYASSKILKVQDFVTFQNCLLTHQFLSSMLPDCFNDHYFKRHSLYYTQTRSSDLGCLFQPSKKATRFGLNLVSHKSLPSNFPSNGQQNIFYQLGKKTLPIQSRKVQTGSWPQKRTL